VLGRRSYTNQLRSRDFFQRTLLLPILQYLFFGFLYVGTRYITVDVGSSFSKTDTCMLDWMNLAGYKRSFYFQVMAIAILSETSVMAEAFGEQRAFRREYAAGAYSILAYHTQWMLRLNMRAVCLSLLFSLVFFFPQNVLNLYCNDNDNDSTMSDRVDGVQYYNMWAFFFVVMCVCSTVGSALALLFISLIPDAEGAAGAHNAIAAVLLQYSGFYLLPCLMPPLVNTAYFISFGKYAFEAMVDNEFATAPYGSEWTLYNSVLNSLDPSLNRWTNLLVLLVYPFLFHALALLSSFLQTRPKSYWAPVEDYLHDKFPQKFRRRENLAHADPDYQLSARRRPAAARNAAGTTKQTQQGQDAYASVAAEVSRKRTGPLP